MTEKDTMIKLSKETEGEKAAEVKEEEKGMEEVKEGMERQEEEMRNH